MHFTAPSMRSYVDCSNATYWQQRWQPTTDYHEEGRTLQFLDTPVVASFKSAFATPNVVMMPGR